MAAFGSLLLFSKILLQIAPVVHGTTHWVVTEDGRIQAQMDSLFSLQRPYDLVALLEQENRAVMLETLKHELLVKKEQIDMNEDKDTGLEQLFYQTDADCLAAKMPLPEFDLYISTVLPLENKGIRPDEYIGASTTRSDQIPDCTNIMSLPYSIHAFEHLEGVRNRANITGSPELGLRNAITHRKNIDEYGQLVYEALTKNASSWVLYNMAAFYWRIKGRPYHVIECLRRSLHYSPRQYKDVALISLANVLHRAHYSNEAAIVVHAALDVSRELNVNHFTLGNIYAVLTDYNKSVICFENTLKIQPEFKAAADRRHAVLCHSKLETVLQAQHKSLQRTLEELRSYQRKHEYWREQQLKLLMEQAPPGVKREQQLGFQFQRNRELMTGMLGEHCYMQTVDGQHVLDCAWRKHNPIMQDHDFLSSWNPPHDANEETEDSDTSATTGTTESGEEDYSRPLHPPIYPRQYGRHSADGKTRKKMAHEEKDWPSKAECNTNPRSLPAWNEYATTYLAPENKGFEVRPLLAEAQGLAPGAEHALPWYPPICVNLADIPEGTRSYDHLTSMRTRSKIPPRLIDNSVRETLLAMVPQKGITEEEVGQRILTALKKKIGPSWVLYNLAALYWRVAGNGYHGIECVRRALYHAPAAHRDVPALNLANLLYHWGRLDDAASVAADALTINDAEPETQLLLGNLRAAKGNITGAIHHYEACLVQTQSAGGVSAAVLHRRAAEMLLAARCQLKAGRSATQSKAEDGCGVGRTGGKQQGPDGSGKMGDGRTRCKTCSGVVESCTVDHKPPSCSRCRQACMFAAEKKSSNEEMCGGHPSSASDSLFGAGMDTRLEELGEYYHQKGICSGDDCHKLMLQAVQRYHQPHTRLEVIDGALHQRFIFVDSSSSAGGDDDVFASGTTAGVDECIVYSDGRRTDGCSRDEFKPFDLDEFSSIMSDPLSSNESKNGDSSTQINKQPSTTTTTKSTTSAADDNVSIAGDSDVMENEVMGNEVMENEVTQNEVTENEVMQNKVTVNEVTQNEITQTEVKQKEVENKVDVPLELVESSAALPGDELLKLSDELIMKLSPDPARLISKRRSQPDPTWQQCRDLYSRVDLEHFMSSWVSMTAKGINLSDHLDFGDPKPTAMGPPSHGLRVPECRPPHDPTTLDLLEGVRGSSMLDYASETTLSGALQRLGTTGVRSVEFVGTKIAVALDRNSTSWVLANQAALFWRVRGDAQRAIDCIKVAYLHSPPNLQDIALLSLANILHRSQRHDDALAVANVALQVAPSLTVTHFTLANIYAAKEDWQKARQFYESTLGLQPSFQPASERLYAIQCKQIYPISPK